jgi:hypothetical protein
MQSRAYLNSTFKLGRKHKYCFKLVQGVEKKYAHHLLINNKERDTCETREKQVTTRSTSPHDHDTRIWKQKVFVFIQKSLTAC